MRCRVTLLSIALSAAGRDPPAMPPSEPQAMPAELVGLKRVDAWGQPDVDPDYHNPSGARLRQLPNL